MGQKMEDSEEEGKDWARRLWIFDILVWMVMEYGIEMEREG